MNKSNKNGLEFQDTFIERTVQDIQESLIRLYKVGARNFLVGNVPDLSKTPMGGAKSLEKIIKTPEDAEKANELLSETVILHNKKLESMLENLKNGYCKSNYELVLDSKNNYQCINKDNNNLTSLPIPFHANITLVDLSGFLTQVMLDRKNKTNDFSNIKADELKYESCYNNFVQISEVFGAIDTSRGDYWANKFTIGFKYFCEKNDKACKEQLQNSYISNYYKLEFPVTSKSSNTSNPPNQPILCSKPEHFIYWDTIHPTTTVHKLIGDSLADYLEKEFPANH